MLVNSAGCESCLGVSTRTRRPGAGLAGCLLAWLATALAGCAPSNLATTAGPPVAGRSVFVMGISPPNAHVLIFDGEVVPALKHVPEDQNYEVFASSGAVFAGMPVDGYIVGEVAADTTIGFRDITLREDGTLDPFLKFCDEVKTPVFTAPPGAITYVGDFAVSIPEKGGFRVAWASNLEGARDHLARHYPALAEGLKQGDYRWLKRSDIDCTKRLTIYLP